MKKQGILLTLGCAFAAIAAAGCSAGSEAYKPGNPIKVGLICLHDTSSTYDKNFIDSMAEAAKNLGNKLSGEPIIKTGVPESQECYTAAKDLVKQGCNVIFADSFGHEAYWLDAVREFPNVTFCHATGTKAKVTPDLPNYHNAFASIYEGRYLAGVAAGVKLQSMVAAESLAQKNYDKDGNIKLGYVGAYPYAEVVSGYTSWFLGVRSVVPNVVMDVQYTFSWYNVQDEKDAARNLIDRGAALISQHADSMGAPGECEDKKVPNVTYNIPTEKDCPNTFVSFSKINWAPYYEAVVNAVYAGKAIEGEVNRNWTGTLATGSVQWGLSSKADAETKKACADAEAAIKAGTLKVFDTDTFTVGGKKVTSYLADVDDMGDYKGETEVIKTVGDKTFFDESALRSAPYFDLRIDGITELNANQQN